MKKEDLTGAFIVGGIGLSLSALFSFILCCCLIQIFSFIGNMDLSFLTDDDWTGYEDMRITITIVPDQPQSVQPILTNPIPQYNQIRGTSPSRHYHDYDEWLPGKDFTCPPLHYSKFIPTIGWNCGEY